MTRSAREAIVFWLILAIFKVVHTTDDFRVPDYKNLRYVHVIVGNKFYVPDFNASSDEFRFPGKLSYRYFLEQSLDIPNPVKLELYELGRELRRRYDTFLDDYYTPESMKLRTTAFATSSMVAQLVSAGLWPPKGIQIWNPELDWQPVTFDYDSSDQDTIMLGTLCPSFEKETNNVISQQNPTFYSQSLAELLQRLKNESWINSNDPIQIILLRLAVENSIAMNQTLPPWAHLMNITISHTMIAYDLLSKTPLQRKLNGGGLLKTILRDAQTLVTGEKQEFSEKISIFSGDDRNLVGVLKNLNQSVFVTPNPGSALIFETYDDDVGNKYIKLIYYFGSDGQKMLPLTLPDCKNRMFCPLEVFSDLVSGVLPEGEESLCRSQSSLSPTIPSLWIGLILLLNLLVRKLD